MNHVPFLATQMGSEGGGIFPKKKKNQAMVATKIRSGCFLTGLVIIHNSAIKTLPPTCQ